MRVHLRILYVLLTLNLTLFQNLVRNPQGVLYSNHSDFLAEHVPARRFLVRSFQNTGELPLWCPHLFAGSPFVHDIQAALFYPPHLALLLVPEEDVGTMLSWFVFLHVLLAGWLMYAYACHRGLHTLAALTAAVGFMFGGRWLMHLLDAGHYILIGLAWLPLVLLAWERVIEGKGWLWGLVAGSAYALLTLSTQPQWTFYSGIFAGLWTLGAAREHKQLGRWAGCGVLIVGMTVGLAAIQLLPTLEAAGQSSRASGVGAEGILAGGLRVLLFLVGPPLSDEPFNLQWEDRGGLALLWLIAAGWAVILHRGRSRYEAGVTVGLFLFAMGGALLFQPLPGFNLFRQPARMAVIATLPIAWLVASTVDTLLDPAGLSAAEKKACRRWFVLAVLGTVILSGGFALRSWLEGRELLAPIYYCIVVPLLIAGWIALSFRARLWLVLLPLDLAMMDALLVRACEREFAEHTPASVDFLAEKRGERGRVLDVGRFEGKQFLGTPLGSGAPMALDQQLDAVRGYSPLDVRRYREFLALIANEPPPLRALDSTLSYPVIGEFPLKNRRPLDLLGVRWLLLPADQKPPGTGWRAAAHEDIQGMYDFIAGGVHPLGEYVIWENANALPRAFVAPQAKPLPEEGELLETFRTTNFRDMVYLEDFDDEPGPRPLFYRPHEVQFLIYEPNRVRIEAKGRTPGFLVLADVWFPGWKCTIDGEETKVYRANYAFRAVKLPAGAHTVEFRFEPASYARGRSITFASLGIVAFLTLMGGAMALRRRH